MMKVGECWWLFDGWWWWLFDGWCPGLRVWNFMKLHYASFISFIFIHNIPMAAAQNVKPRPRSIPMIHSSKGYYDMIDTPWSIPLINTPKLDKMTQCTFIRPLWYTKSTLTVKYEMSTSLGWWAGVERNGVKLAAPVFGHSMSGCLPLCPHESSFQSKLDIYSSDRYSSFKQFLLKQRNKHDKSWTSSSTSLRSEVLAFFF